MAHAPKLVASTEFDVEAAKRELDFNLQVACSHAASLGIDKARGENSLTQLCYDYQRDVAAGTLVRGHNVPLYAAYADAHDKWIADPLNGKLGAQAISKDSRDAATSSMLTFTDPFVLYQASLSGDDKAPSEEQNLYARILRVRSKMEKEDLAPGSALSHFARVNRAIGKLGEESAASIAPDKLVISDDQLIAWLAKDGKAGKSDERRLQDIVDMIAKFEKINPDIARQLDGAKRTIRAVKADVAKALIDAEIKAEADAAAELIKKAA